MPLGSDLLEQLECAEMIVSYIGLCINLFLIFLIRRHTIKTIKPYKPILYQNCASDFIYTISTIIVRPLIDVQNGTALFFVRTPIPYESPHITLALALWYDGFALMFYIAAVPVQFVYRYIFIVKRTPVTRKLHASMVFVAVLCCSLTSFLLYLTVKDNHKVMEKGIAVLNADPSYNSENAKHFLFSDTRSPLVIFFFGTFLVFTVISGFIIVFTSYSVWKTTRNLVSPVARDAHDQMTRILFLQVGIPVVLCYIPVGFFITHIILYSGPSPIPKMVLPIVSVFPIVNAILVICFMKSYRNFILSNFHLFRALLFKAKQNTVYSISNKSVVPHSTS